MNRKNTSILLVLSGMMALCLSLFHFRSHAGEDIGLEHTLNRHEFHIGDRIELTITVPAREGMRIMFPEKPDKRDPFEFLRSFPVRESGFGRARREGMTYVLTTYNTGEHILPSVSIGHRSQKDEEWAYIELSGIEVNIRSLLSGDDTDIRDLKDVLHFGLDIRILMWIFFSIIAVFSLALALWLRRRHIRAEQEKARNRKAHEIAYDELRSLKAMDLPGKGQIKEYYIWLSIIVRMYLENRFAIRAPEMTTEEFLENMRGSSLLEPGHKDLLKEFLFHCDLVKFARYGPTELEMIDSLRAAEKLVDQTKEIEEEEVSG